MLLQLPPVSDPDSFLIRTVDAATGQAC